MSIRQITKKGMYFPNRKAIEKVIGTTVNCLDWNAYGAHNLEADLGISLDTAERNKSAIQHILDSAIPSVLTGATATPTQFTQFWYAETVQTMIRAMRIIEIMGIETGGDLTTSEIVRTISESVGTAKLRNPNSASIPTASFNVNYESRDVQILESGMEIDNITSAQLAQARINEVLEKHKSIAISHASSHNSIGFYGLAIADKKIFGLLNDPNLLPYTTVPVGAGGATMWASKTAQEIYDDVVYMVDRLFEQSGNLVDALSSPTKLVLAGSAVQFLSKMNAIGTSSVRHLLKENYPLMEIMSAPEFNGANGGNNVAYLKAEDVEFICGTYHVPVTLQPQSMVPTARGHLELFYSNLAGTFIVRPLTVVRVQGV